MDTHIAPHPEPEDRTAPLSARLPGEPLEAEEHGDADEPGLAAPSADERLASAAPPRRKRRQSLLLGVAVVSLGIAGGSVFLVSPVQPHGSRAGNGPDGSPSGGCGRGHSAGTACPVRIARRRRSAASAERGHPPQIHPASSGPAAFGVAEASCRRAGRGARLHAQPSGLRSRCDASRRRQWPAPWLCAQRARQPARGPSAGADIGVRAGASCGGPARSVALRGAGRAARCDLDRDGLVECGDTLGRCRPRTAARRATTISTRRLPHRHLARRSRRRHARRRPRPR